MYSQPYYMNPAVQATQQRLQMMEAQYPQFAPQNNPYPPQTTQPVNTTNVLNLKGRPVSNEEEANAAMIDFDGSLFVFPDKAHGKIYTKQLGMDGNILFLRYSLDNPQEQKAAPESTVDLSGYVTKEQLDKALSDIDSKLSKLGQKIPVKGAKS